MRGLSPGAWSLLMAAGRQAGERTHSVKRMTRAERRVDVPLSVEPAWQREQALAC